MNNAFNFMLQALFACSQFTPVNCEKKGMFVLSYLQNLQL